mmetsp:Transcript_14552/g.27971  ORF Transcript_14552/g.27971 Transcript_14552/m.27971 type:complete len:250 (-) Transcript_14552:1006-1755(-)
MCTTGFTQPFEQYSDKIEHVSLPNGDNFSSPHHPVAMLSYQSGAVDANFAMKLQSHHETTRVVFHIHNVCLLDQLRSLEVLAASRRKTVNVHALAKPRLHEGHHTSPSTRGIPFCDFAVLLVDEVNLPRSGAPRCQGGPVHHDGHSVNLFHVLGRELGDHVVARGLHRRRLSDLVAVLGPKAVHFVPDVLLKPLGSDVVANHEVVRVDLRAPTLVAEVVRVAHHRAVAQRPVALGGDVLPHVLQRGVRI